MWGHSNVSKNCGQRQEDTEMSSERMLNSIKHKGVSWSKLGATVEDAGLTKPRQRIR